MEDFIIMIIYVSLSYQFLKHIFYLRSDYYKATRLSYYRTLSNKGAYGEYLICEQLRKMKFFRYILVNCYLPNASGETTEVDVIVLTRRGIVVIESKNYRGRIIGNVADYYWNQVFNGNRRYKFYNPIKQNKGHVSAVKRTLKLNRHEHIHSLIVFGKNSSVKEISGKTFEAQVIKVTQLKKVIHQLYSKAEIIYTDTQLEEMYQTLCRYQNVSKSVKKRHVKVVKRKKLS